MRRVMILTVNLIQTKSVETNEKQTRKCSEAKKEKEKNNHDELD